MSSEPPTTESGRRLVEAMAGDDARTVCSALVNATFEEPDNEWLYDRCLAAASTGPWEVTAVAATCIGHLARLRGYTRDDTIQFLESLAASSTRIRSYAEDAIEDVRHGLRLHAD